MEVSVKRLERMLVAACERTGIADADAVIFDSGEGAFIIGSTRVSASLARDGARQVWRVRHEYDVMDLSTNGWKTVTETVGTFPAGDEAQAVRAAVMKVVGSVVDAAIDEAA